MSFQLSIQFLKSDLERVENQEYFMKNFQFADMIKFFSQIESMKQINEKKQSINLFYDRFLALKSMYRTFYVQLKWIAVMHQIIQRFKENTPLYGYTLKALQICLEVIIKSQKQQGPYEKYLITNLVKPYLQYLSKLCLLNMPEQTAKYDSNSALNILNKSQQGQDQNQDSTNHESQAIQQQNHTTIILIDWYRKYNFISGTLQTFQTILSQTYRFFNSTFPYLTNIGRFMNQDLNALIFKLKYMYRSLKKSNVTIIELDQLQIKLKVFTNKCVNYEEQNIFETSSKIEEFQKKDLQQFLESPLKPSQLKLFTKKSVGTPSSIFNKF